MMQTDEHRRRREQFISDVVALALEQGTLALTVTPAAVPHRGDLATALLDTRSVDGRSVGQGFKRLLEDRLANREATELDGLSTEWRDDMVHARSCATPRCCRLTTPTTCCGWGWARRICSYRERRGALTAHLATPSCFGWASRFYGPTATVRPSRPGVKQAETQSQGVSELSSPYSPDVRRASVAVINWLPGVLMALTLLTALSRKLAIALSDRRAAQADGQAEHVKPGSGADRDRFVEATDAGRKQRSQLSVTTPS